MPLNARATHSIQAPLHFARFHLSYNDMGESKKTEIELDGHLTQLSGVGELRAQTLEDMDINTIRDMLSVIPRSYRDRSNIVNIEDLEDNVSCGIKVCLSNIKKPHPSRRRAPATATGVDATGEIHITSFAGKYFASCFTTDDEALLFGQQTTYKNKTQFVVEAYENTASKKYRVGGLVAQYSGVGDIGHERWRGFVRQALERLPSETNEALPSSVREKRTLCKWIDSMKMIHTPDTMTDAEIARKRMAYEEFFLLETGVALRRRATRESASGVQIQITDEIKKRIEARLPFTLTASQSKALKNIEDDLTAPLPMNRLLQGDVGSGKTAVAISAILMCVAQGKQAALMAPTEILAEQHLHTLKTWLEGSKLRIAFLGGSLKATEKNAVKDKLKNGEIDIVVGTHALVQKGVEFNALGLAVIDEQHKFGVMQRHLIRKKGLMPNILVMTATPIPRSLALTVYGDLDVSSLTELPKGRKAIATHIRTPSARKKVWRFIHDEIKQGRQAYYVCPLVSKSEKLKCPSVEEMYATLKSEAMPNVRVALLHGKLHPSEKDTTMKAFAKHEIDVLVATSIIEVGLDVGNATVMVIDGAERFGLSALHQLRGRIGRGEYASNCILITGSRGASKERITTLAESTDGFKIAEIDLKQRGPGEFFGTKQHGLPLLYVGDIINDIDILTQARDDAFELVNKDPALKLSDHFTLRKTVLKRYAGTLDLVEVG